MVNLYGGDYSKYNPSIKNNTGKDTFAIIQIGGYQGGIYTQANYNDLKNQAGKMGQHAHAYIWYQVGSSQSAGKTCMDYFLPKLGLPKGALVALDCEAGASGSATGNTDAILYAMDRIKNAGYYPIFYSGASYGNAHYQLSRIIQRYPNSLWIASYWDESAIFPDMKHKPNFNGLSIWQYASGGGDRNVDVVGVTNYGYGSSPSGGGTPSKPVPGDSDDKKKLLDEVDSIYKDKAKNKVAFQYCQSLLNSMRFHLYDKWLH